MQIGIEVEGTKVTLTVPPEATVEIIRQSNWVNSPPPAASSLEIEAPFKFLFEPVSSLNLHPKIQEAVRRYDLVADIVMEEPHEFKHGSRSTHKPRKFDNLKDRLEANGLHWKMVIPPHVLNRLAEQALNVLEKVALSQRVNFPKAEFDQASFSGLGVDLALLVLTGSQRLAPEAGREWVFQTLSRFGIRYGDRKFPRLVLGIELLAKTVSR